MLLSGATKDATGRSRLNRPLSAPPVRRDGGRRVSPLGPGHNAVVATIVSHEPQAPNFYKARLANLPSLSHVTIEVERCA
jgi:hypothetical protein